MVFISNVEQSHKQFYTCQLVSIFLQYLLCVLIFGKEFTLFPWIPLLSTQKICDYCPEIVITGE